MSTWANGRFVICTNVLLARFVSSGEPPFKGSHSPNKDGNPNPRELVTPLDGSSVNTNLTVAVESPVAPLEGKLASFRLIPRIETYPKVVSFVQTPLGKVVLLALFGLGLWASMGDWLPLTLCLAAITFLPTKRRLLVSICTLAFTFLVPRIHGSVPLSIIATFVQVFTLAALFFWCAVLWPRSLYGRRPVVFLLCTFSAFIVLGTILSKNERAYTLLWQFLFIFATYVWFIGYSLLDANSPKHDNFGLQLGAYSPFWGSSNTPFPKGASYLRQIEARDAEQLAVTQLKGLKLLAWSLLILMGLRWSYSFFHEHLGIPTFAEALKLSVHGQPLPWYGCWGGLIFSFFMGLMSVSATGHRIVACCRMAGFNALRNTYRPLSSVTVAEFFNRYYYYFKELLVDFFFYPTFLRYFKKSPKLRMAAAIFAAACFGNAFYHFTASLDFVRTYGLWHALVSFQVYFFYCALLAAALTISNLRRRKKVYAGFLRSRLLPATSVIFFYCLLDVFGSSEHKYPLIEHFRFFGHLFFLNF